MQYRDDKKIDSLIKSIKVESKKIYLMRNSAGQFKIGISNNPTLRKRTLELASGLSIEIVAIYAPIHKRAQTCEMHLHKIFAKYRGIGEWFDFPESYTLEKFESVCDKVGMTKCQIDSNISVEYISGIETKEEYERIKHQIDLEKSKPYDHFKWRSIYNIKSKR